MNEKIKQKLETSNLLIGIGGTGNNMVGLIKERIKQYEKENKAGFIVIDEDAVSEDEREDTHHE